MSRLFDLLAAVSLFIGAMDHYGHGDETESVTAPPVALPPSAEPVAIEPEQIARRVLATADLVLQKHIDPPTRQQMILAALRSLAEKAGKPQRTGLSRQVSGLATNDELGRLIQELWSESRNSQKASDGELQAAMLDGLIGSVPGGQFVPAREFKVQQQIRGNRYVGIGIQLGLDPERKPVIMNPFPRGPARLAGARPGDVILTVDGASTENVTLDKVVEMLRGEEGTPVTIVVRHMDSTELRTLSMIRGVIPFQSITGYRRASEESWEFHVDPSEPIAYLRIQDIRINTLHDLRQIARELEPQGIGALVLDLRFNSGSGEVQHAVRLADELLEDGAIGRVRDAEGGVKDYQAGPDSLFKRIPMVVLVNQYTRSDAEFMAAALQDNQRAIVVGQRTGGYGYVLTPVDLPEGIGGMVLRTGMMERADGRPLHRPGQSDCRLVQARPSSGPHEEITEPDPPGDWGVVPGHSVVMSSKQVADWFKWRGEQDLIEPPTTDRSDAPADPQLAKALELLRAMIQTTARE